VIWYDKAKNYRQFEFIWDPSKEPINGGGRGGRDGVPPAGAQGQNGIFGQQPTEHPRGLREPAQIPAGADAAVKPQSLLRSYQQCFS